MSKFVVVEKQFEYKGHDCICIFGCRGYRCGYVSVDDNKEFNEYDIECHGGLSFSGTLPYDYGQKETYYIGFDCGHICDGNDHNLALKYGLINEKRFNELLEMQIHLPTFLEPVRSLEYVEDECKKIVDQLEAGEMNIYLGNLSIKQIEREYSVAFTDEDKQWLQEHHQDEASKIQSDKWHFFDIPRVMMTGSHECAKEIYDRFEKYSFEGQFWIGIEE